MIKITKGLSDYVLYQWYSGEDNAPIWHTKSDILRYKEKFDKALFWHRIKFWSIIFSIIICAAIYAAICFYIHDIVPSESYIADCTLVRLPLMFYIPIACSVILPNLDRKLLYRRRSFYETFGSYFKEDKLGSAERKCI